MKISENGKELIKKYEKCRLDVYLCPAGKKTVGYGHTGLNISLMKVGDTITQEQADKYFEEDLIKFENAVNKYNDKYNFNQNQFDALVSFAFNIGNITQLTKHGNRSIEEISKAMIYYNKCKGKFSQGLYNRRLEEQKLFNMI